MARQVVIIGGGAAGATAAIQARKTDREAGITLIEREPHPEYSRCGLPYAYSGVTTLEKLVTHPRSFYESVAKVQLRLSTEAIKVDTRNHEIEIREVDSNRSESIHYGNLILATGAGPTVPPIKGLDKEGVFVVRTVTDIERLTRYVQTTSARGAVILGAGLIGMEMTEALLHRKLQVTIIEILPQILPAILDTDMSALVRDEAEKSGAKVLTSTRVQEVLGKEHVEGVIASADQIASEIVIIAASVKPNVALAKAAGIEIGDAGGIAVNEQMHTSVPGVYAAGDCVETTCIITGRKALIQLATTAVRQAAVAGSNAAGGNEIYEGSTRVGTTRLFGKEVATAGLTTSLATSYGLSPASARVAAKSRLHYMPDATDITAKLICDRSSGKLIGAQIIGEGASWRANFASLAMRLRLDVEAFQEQETSYAPPNSPVWDPMTLAAQALQRKLEVRQPPEAGQM